MGTGLMSPSAGWRGQRDCNRATHLSCEHLAGTCPQLRRQEICGTGVPTARQRITNTEPTSTTCVCGGGSVMVGGPAVGGTVTPLLPAQLRDSTRPTDTLGTDRHRPAPTEPIASDVDRRRQTRGTRRHGRHRQTPTDTRNTQTRQTSTDAGMTSAAPTGAYTTDSQTGWQSTLTALCDTSRYRKSSFYPSSHHPGCLCLANEIRMAAVNISRDQSVLKPKYKCFSV